MAVVLAVGGAFIGGLIVYDNLSDSYGWYDDYGDYGDYEDYGDAEERRSKRIEALIRDTELAADELSDYKCGTVNPELASDKLKEQTAMKVSVSAMDKDVNRKIQEQIDAQAQKKTKSLRQELAEIDMLLLKIEEIERGTGE